MQNRFQTGSAAARTAFAAVLIGLAAGTARTQSLPTVNLPKPDSAGWIRIWRGDNQGDFSIYTGNGTPASEASKTPFGSTFTAQGKDTIRTTGSPGGQLIFKQVFSHYIMEVQLRWPGNVFNTGTMEKVQWNDVGQGGGLPTCIECQGDPNQGMGQVWCLGPTSARPWITFKGKTDSHGAIADSSQKAMDFGGSGGQNCIVGFPGWQKPYPATVNAHGWVTIRTEVHGKDTTRHFVDGQKVMEYWNPRIAKSNDANSLVKSLTEGMVTVQSEGGEVWYRGWRIKLLPEDPLYAGLYTPTTLGASRPVRKGPEPYRLGFNGATLTILSEGRPALDLAGRRIQGVPAEGALKP
jgi:3-keto-disaccharide hydrolase